MRAEVQDELILIETGPRPAGACAACGQPIRAGEGVMAEYRGRLLRFRCSGCLASFRSEPGHYVAARDYCCSTGTCEESPASEWAL